MSEAMMNNFEKDILPVISESRILAINAKHGFISLEHFFVAILNTHCLAKSYLVGFEAENPIAWLQKLNPNTSTKALKNSLPLTIHAERIIRHANHIASLNKESHTNSIHLLLSILSYENQVTELVKKKGIIFEDIAASYFKHTLPKIRIELKLRHFRKPSRITTFFGLGPSLKNFRQAIYDHASSLWVYQQYDDCITTCQTGLKLIPDHHELKVLLAHCLLSKRDYNSAAGHFHELTNIFPDNSDLLLPLSYCYDHLGDYLRAQEILDKMLVEEPYNAIILNNKGFNLYLQNRYAEAIPFFKKAIETNHSFAYPWNNLGFVKYKLGDTEQGLTLIDKGLEFDKGNSYAYMYKGTIFLEQGNTTLAMEQLQLALKYGFTATYGEGVLRLIEKCK